MSTSLLIGDKLLIYCGGKGWSRKASFISEQEVQQNNSEKYNNIIELTGLLNVRWLHLNKV